MAKELNELAEEAWNHIRTGNIDLALQLLSGPISLVNEAERPKGYPDALAMFAYCSGVITKKRKESIQLGIRATKLDSLNPRNYFLLGRLYEIAGSKKNAFEAYQQGLKIQPGYPPIVQAIGKLGTRRRPVLKFLARDHFLNVALGRLRHSLFQKPIK
ncbi:MAG: hypothetical protein KDC71_13785 [Acidobacteria bacterium]|nr:hypothetical protein [Acidobacteriota bacterium]